MYWDPEEYLEVDPTTKDLEYLEQHLRTASLAVDEFMEVLACQRKTWETAPEADRPRLFDEAKAAALQRHVTDIRTTLDSEKCDTCHKSFSFYWKLAANAPVLRQRPTQCLPCKRAGKFYKTWLKYRRLALDENPLAQHYLSEQIAPPRPAQYEAVMNWREYLPDNFDYHSLGLVLVGDSFTGKTSACYHALYHLVANQEYEGFLAVNSSHLNGIPEKVMDRTLGEFMERLYSTPFLLVDDLDKVRITPRVASELWNLFEVRLRERNAPVFVTMNTRTKEDFVNLFSGKDGDHRQIGLSIYNRLKKFCQFIDFDIETQPVDRRPWLEKRSTVNGLEPSKAADGKGSAR
jgi:DNA replication protein DnaC